MRFLSVAVFFCVLAMAIAMFRGAPRGIATINHDTGDVMYLAVPNRRLLFDKRRCLFCPADYEDRR